MPMPMPMHGLDDGEPLTSAAPVSHRGALPPCVSVARGGHVGGPAAWAWAAAEACTACAVLLD